MRKKDSRLLTTITIILPFIIVIGMGVLFLQNHLYNTRERVHLLSDGRHEGTAYVFDDITVDFTTRGGDSGAWISPAVQDENGNVILEEPVGTIYEMLIFNNSSDTITDWVATVYIPEEMCVNNTWNGNFEYHQNVNSGNEKVQTLDLAEYSNYDIVLDHFMSAIGPMVWLHEGDYFAYYPEEEWGDKPILPKADSAEKESYAKVGFIMYMEGKPIDYIINFSKGEIRYYMHRSILKNPFFWVFGIALIIWISCFLALIIVRLNLKRYAEQQKRDEQIIEQTMRTIVNFIEAKDPNTMGHSLRVAQYSRMLAGSIGFSEEECRHIYYIALMHDCGKIYIPDEILTKPSKLTEEEYELMKKHTVYGRDILRDFTAIEGIGMGALSHHERYDGKGYPDGLAGEDIPIMARIICISDAFDAMNSHRCYRNALTPDVILSELKNNSGKQFDPVIIDRLLKLIESGVIKMSGNEAANKE